MYMFSNEKEHTDVLTEKLFRGGKSPCSCSCIYTAGASWTFLQPSPNSHKASQLSRVTTDYMAATESTRDNQTDRQIDKHTSRQKW